MTLPITTLTATILAIIFIVQTFSVIAIRRSKGIAFGQGDASENRHLLKRVRGHANMTEQMPIFLIMLGLLEFQGLSSNTVLHVLAGLFVFGRISHALYFLDIGFNYRFRTAGMIPSLLAQIGAAASLVLAFF